MQDGELRALLGLSCAAIALVIVLRQREGAGNRSQERMAQEDCEDERPERDEPEECEPEEATLKHMKRDKAHSFLGGDQALFTEHDEPKEDSAEPPPKDEEPATPTPKQRNRRHSDFAVASIIS